MPLTFGLSLWVSGTSGGTHPTALWPAAHRMRVHLELPTAMAFVPYVFVLVQVQGLWADARWHARKRKAKSYEKKVLLGGIQGGVPFCCFVLNTGRENMRQITGLALRWQRQTETKGKLCEGGVGAATAALSVSGCVPMPRNASTCSLQRPKQEI